MKTQRLDADAAGIARAAALLRAGRLVAFGTETVYGLGADAADTEAVASVYAAKGRPQNNPLIAHMADIEAAFEQVVETELARLLASRFWPGPLTLVLPRRADSTVCRQAAAGLDTLAVRVPFGEAARRLLLEVGRPIAAPSANRSGRVSPSCAEHVLDGLDGRIDAVLDCGPCSIGLESTVVQLASGRAVLLRPGGITAEAIEALLAACGGPPLDRFQNTQPRNSPNAPETPSTRPAAPETPSACTAAPEITSARTAAPEITSARTAAPEMTRARPAAPGMLASHYAPSLPVRLDAREARPDEALLAFGEAPAGAGLSWNLSPEGDLPQAAARLFEGLRFLDAQGSRIGLAGIAVMPIPSHGLGLAIRDRLRRAAAPR